MDYWAECLESSFEENGISITSSQLSCIAADIEVAHEQYGMAYPTPENPLIGEVSTLKRELETERDKVICRECNGHGSITTHGPIHSATSSCFRCHGEGRHAP